MPAGVSSRSHWSLNQPYFVSSIPVHAKDVSILLFGTFKPFIWLLKSSSQFLCRWWRTQFPGILHFLLADSCGVTWSVRLMLLCSVKFPLRLVILCTQMKDLVDWNTKCPFLYILTPQVALSDTRLLPEPLINKSSRSFWVCAEMSGHGSHASAVSFPAGQISPLYSACQHFPHCSSSNVFLVSALWLCGIIFVRDLLHGLT